MIDKFTFTFIPMTINHDQNELSAVAHHFDQRRIRLRNKRESKIGDHMFDHMVKIEKTNLFYLKFCYSQQTFDGAV